MAIPQVVKERFQQMAAAARAGDICLMEVTRSGSKSKKKAYAICVAWEENGDVCTLPVGEIPEADPLDLYIPPDGAKNKS